MGTFRLLLSYMVMLSHVGFSIMGHNQGAFAVVSFLLLSGYVMTALIDKHYLDKAKLADFYKDRALRIMPQFVFYMVATLLFAAIFNPKTIFLEHIDIYGIVYNLAIIPLNLPFFIDCRIIPQAWSLGSEVQFYLLIPLILLLRIRSQIILLSFIVFIAAYLGYLNTDMYGYRLLPGTLFIFLIGSAIRRSTKKEKKLFMATYAACVILFTILLLKVELNVPFSYEVLLGIIIGAPLVAALAKIKSGKTDLNLGNLSYGVFLNHQLFMWIFEQFKLDISYIPTTIALILVCSVAAAISYWLIERPAVNLRHTLRNRKTPNQRLVDIAE